MFQYNLFQPAVIAVVLKEGIAVPKTLDPLTVYGKCRGLAFLAPES